MKKQIGITVQFFGRVTIINGVTIKWNSEFIERLWYFLMYHLTVHRYVEDKLLQSTFWPSHRINDAMKIFASYKLDFINLIRNTEGELPRPHTTKTLRSIAQDPCNFLKRQGDGYVLGDHVTVDCDAATFVQAMAEFDACWAVMHTHSPSSDTYLNYRTQAIEWLKGATRVYSQDFLPELNDLWIRAKRYDLQQMHIRALYELYTLTVERGEETAFKVLMEAFQKQPLRSDLVLLIMKVCHAKGSDNIGWMYYNDHVKELKATLNQEPDSFTQALYFEYNFAQFEKKQALAKK